MPEIARDTDDLPLYEVHRRRADKWRRRPNGREKDARKAVCVSELPVLSDEDVERLASCHETGQTP